MTAEQLSAAVMNSVHRAGLVEVEVSARHVHLTKADAEVLFGIGAELEPVRPLSQPGQFLAKQRVTLVGPKATVWSWGWKRPCGSPATWPVPVPSSWRAPAAPWS